jgi:four helix bundle protein
MSRDHTKLRVFHDAHAQVLAIYKHTKSFPKDEWFGLRIQMCRAAASVPTNLVEGNARQTTKDYCKFLVIALGSARELAYLVALAVELGYLDSRSAVPLRANSVAVAKQMQKLVDEMERRAMAERRARRKARIVTKDQRPQTTDR